MCSTGKRSQAKLRRRSLLARQAEQHGCPQVDICCFDKTGTLTSDNMVLEGLTGVPGYGEELLTDMKTAKQEVIRVLAACQALIQVDGKFVGDPLEKASFTATGATGRPCLSASAATCCLLLAHLHLVARESACM